MYIVKRTDCPGSPRFLFNVTLVQQNRLFTGRVEDLWLTFHLNAQIQDLNAKLWCVPISTVAIIQWELRHQITKQLLKKNHKILKMWNLTWRKWKEQT